VRDSPHLDGTPTQPRTPAHARDRSIPSIKLIFQRPSSLRSLSGCALAGLVIRRVFLQIRLQIIARQTLCFARMILATPQATASASTAFHNRPDSVQHTHLPAGSDGAVLASRPSVALLTPWNQQCGNAEYAKRLATGLRQFADIQPIEMVNFTDPDLEAGRFRRRMICRKIIRDLVAASGDLVHIQHEFCFFGRRIRESNRNFRRAVRSIKTPLVVTLHTWPWSRPLAPRKRRWLNWTALIQRRFTKRHLLRTLRRADAIVVHSKDTYQQLINESPRWKKKTFLIPIPVEPIDHRGITPPLRKRPDEHWVVLPGFISRYKGHSHALAALAALPDTYRLVVAGGVHPNDRSGNDYWMQLLAEADALGVQSRVIYTGFIDDPEKQAAILSQADCFLLPYAEVGQSGSAVLADALAHFRPVVTSTAKSMFVYRGSLDTVGSSVSVDVTNAELLAETIASCVEPGTHHNLQMPRHQQAVYETYSLERTQERYQRVYAFALSRKQNQ